MNSFHQTIRQTLLDRKDHLMQLWIPRLRGMLTDEAEETILRLAEIWYGVLLNFFAGAAVAESLKESDELRAYSFNALSISRYALLALLPYENSLDCYSRLNEAYEPLLQMAHQAEQPAQGSLDRMAGDFSRTFARYLQNILNDAADAIILLDIKDHIVMWNNAAEQIYGWTRSEMLGRHISRIVPQDAASRQEIEWISQQVREKGFLRNYRTHRLTRDGKTVTIEVTRTAIYDEQHHYIGSSVISRDLTEQEKLRDQLVHSEKLSAVGTLAAGIAHEIGSPLTAISSISQLLRVKSQDPFIVEKVSLIQQSIDRIARIVRTLVDFSKPTQAKVESVYLNSVVENVVQIIKYDRRLKYRAIVTDLQADIPQIQAGFDQLLQVLINLCLNAADAMEEKADGRLTIKTWSQDSRVYASVVDNGSGIRPEHLPHIFEPFFTTKGDRRGTGLGLWVSYNIIKNLQGDIQVVSQPAVGTTFTLSLPALTLNPQIH
ncbi:MAG TPA: ATP-binding protein [bacterium]|nr:ATP-binding protein [bacterium]